MNINNNIVNFRQTLPAGCKLIAVSKTHPVAAIREAYRAGQRHFGENKVQELIPKYQAREKDITWHMIGHLQRNKARQAVTLSDRIHSVDSLRLARTLHKEAARAGLVEVELPL
jgi:PLP dependent protein